MKSDFIGVTNFKIFQAELGNSEQNTKTVIKISNITGNDECYLSAGCNEFEITKDDLKDFVNKLMAYIMEIS